ncbi:hypothetical protein DL96DRAFT_697119 [Flagelloscypha sp. PMI_526]|nr:hypothetical protein DL96DRAFT_697119 [Flagelloscypha sp. PMI_526]
MATFTLHKIEYLEESKTLDSDSEDESGQLSPLQLSLVNSFVFCYSGGKSQFEVFLLTDALNYIISHGLDSVPTSLVRKVQRCLRPLWFKTMVHITSVFHLVDDGRDDDAEHSDDDCFDLGPTKEDLIARQWRKLGNLLEFTDPDDDMAGCSWRKCVLHNREGPQMMRKCKGCYGAQYCGKTCQKRDWVEGTHKTACR